MAVADDAAFDDARAAESSSLEDGGFHGEYKVGSFNRATAEA